ncbi:MAG TPA: molybdopterin cofactor-binding domain-containing protein [Virgibacillus sp.]|nr:molybdopterin cofactor-binding domain-containing protein [Virgibacillus sp.]
MDKLVGQGVKRREDPKLITGNATYLDDIPVPGLLHAAVLRSPHPHAKIISIDTTEAMAHPDVIAVYTGKDLEGKINPVPTSWRVPASDLIETDQYPLAIDTVRYVGDGVAFVVAKDRYVVQDVLALIDVEYEVLPSVANQKDARKEDAPQIYEQVPNNTAFTYVAGEVTDEDIDEAEVVVRGSYNLQRVAPSPMETRNSMAQYNPATQDLKIYIGSQNPHIHRMVLSEVLDFPEHKLQVKVADMGGGFGGKIGVYPDEALVAYAAKDLQRPVKWIEERNEHFQSANGGRDMMVDVELAGTKDGYITALRVENTANIGAYLATFGPGNPTIDFGLMVSGAYKIPKAQCTTYGMYTNTMSVDSYRGAGKPEATYMLERVLEDFAREINMDPVEVRRLNFAKEEEFPFTNAQGLIYDSGDYDKALNKALEMADYEKLRAEQKEARKNGKYIGIGLASYVELSGFGPSPVAGGIGFQGGIWENSTVRVHPRGTVTVFTGTSPHGQAHDTTFTQIVADKLGIPYDDINFVFNDTRSVSMGWGTYGSRSLAVGGNAVAIATDKVVEKARLIAAHLLEEDVEDVVFQRGVFSVKDDGTKQMSFQEIAKAANFAWSLPEGMEPGLEEQTFYDPSNFTYPFGTHIVVVEVDIETGEIEILRYIAVDDSGNIINPMVAKGQVHGAIAQGVGQALWEGIQYDETGQLLSGSFMDYTMPKARFFPNIESAFTVTPTPVNQLGSKGIAESGVTGSIASTVNAVIDALAPLGVKNIEMPLTPEKVWRAISKGEENE